MLRTNTLIFLPLILFFSLLSQSQVFIPFAFWQKLDCNQVVFTFTTATVSSITVPYLCNQMTIHAWGAGAGGGTGTGAGSGRDGGAGGYATSSTIHVNYLDPITVRVGQGGRGGASGCASPGTGGTGAYIGGTSVANTSGTAGAGVGVGGNGGSGADGGFNGGIGGYGGGGAGSGSAAGSIGGGGGVRGGFQRRARGPYASAVPPRRNGRTSRHSKYL